MTMVNGERRDNIYSASLSSRKSFDNSDPTESAYFLQILIFFYYIFLI